MLVLSRKRGEDVVLVGMAEQAVRIRVMKLAPRDRTIVCPDCATELKPPAGDPLVQLGIEAPHSIRVLRSEHPDAARETGQDEPQAEVIMKACALVDLFRDGVSPLLQRKALMELAVAIDNADLTIEHERVALLR